jgi:hypothetical protein
MSIFLIDMSRLLELHSVSARPHPAPSARRPNLDAGFPQRRYDLLRMRATAAPPIVSNMNRKGYAVWWQEGRNRRHAGKLQLGPLHLLLSGNGSGRLAVPLDQIVSVEYRGGELEVEHRGGSRLRIGNLDGPGALLEVSEALAV